jgi:Gluconate 2-dehydrogenase subunit 3
MVATWSLEQIELLRAVMDRIIPRDQDPSATDLGVDRYLLHQVQSGAVPEKDRVLSGIAALAETARIEHGRMFQDLSDDEQDRILRNVAAEPWFQVLAELVAEGYYADPGNGGNAGARSWVMIGYEHRLTDGPSGPAAAETFPETVRARTGDVPDDMEARRSAETAEKA